MSKSLGTHPFIVNYAITYSKNDKTDSNLRYNTLIESTVIEPEQTLAIESNKVWQEDTGSIITKAYGDPTKDEPETSIR